MCIIQNENARYGASKEYCGFTRVALAKIRVSRLLYVTIFREKPETVLNLFNTDTEGAKLSVRIMEVSVL